MSLVHQCLPVPCLDRTLKKVARRGGEVVLADGTLVPARRRTGKASRPNCSGKHRRHGLHVLALSGERGHLIVTAVVLLIWLRT
ncbi:hypothetical protein [Streptomyces rhizosphaerihabitans]|uniref:hypothetical protein n=1 Tax=Streptomyces rhizosphaerihabitans TaxID=1266770 RepID=UPI0021BF0518|nr:hypothetical protein [Streptomyces rhizosphaerihabitans]MCT9007093.1 hypothetical protein [Streptomyces rhizosphaerihabitans]